MALNVTVKLQPLPWASPENRKMIAIMSSCAPPQGHRKRVAKSMFTGKMSFTRHDYLGNVPIETKAILKGMLKQGEGQICVISGEVDIFSLFPTLSHSFIQMTS